MKSWLLVVFFLLLLARAPVCAQETTTESQIEELASASDEEPEDDSYLQVLHGLKRHPLNLNYASAEELGALRILTPLQVDALLSYRKLLGLLISIYELQAVPTWNLATIRRVLPFVSVSQKMPVQQLLLNRFKGGTHTVFLRDARVLQKQKGFDDSGVSAYQGNPDHLLLRYKYNYKGELQAGVTAEKDAGEPFFRAGRVKGFDFYSAHVFARKMGIIKALALGDYTVNFGQGLIQWQSLAFKKGGDVVNLKRQSASLSPYSSVGEYNFFRGAAISLARGGWELSLFGSRRAQSATGTTADDIFSSISTSGYHRTEGERQKRKRMQETVLGAALHYRYASLKVGVNGLHYRYSKVLQPEPSPYNSLKISGNNGYNLSVDYSATYKNAHFFGEAATDGHSGKALISGLLLAVDTKADIALGYRSIESRFHAFRGNAFTESALPSNETGFYAALSFRPVHGLKLEAYADQYIFPFIRYRIDAPGRGQDYLLQATYQPRRGVELYARFRNERKSGNDPMGSGPLHAVLQVPRQSVRVHLDHRFDPHFSLKTRVDLVWYNKRHSSAEEGFLIYTEGSFDISPHLSGNIRLQCFDTDGFNSRIYAYESDVLYGYSIPPFFHSGSRLYTNLNWSVTKSVSVWLKWAQTFFHDLETIGSGGSEIRGNNKSEVKMQVRLEL